VPVAGPLTRLGPLASRGRRGVFAVRGRPTGCSRAPTRARRALRGRFAPWNRPPPIRNPASSRPSWSTRDDCIPPRDADVRRRAPRATFRRPERGGSSTSPVSARAGRATPSAGSLRGSARDVKTRHRGRALRPNPLPCGAPRAIASYAVGRDALAVVRAPLRAGGMTGARWLPASSGSRHVYSAGP